VVVVVVVVDEGSVVVVADGLVVVDEGPVVVVGGGGGLVVVVDEGPVVAVVVVVGLVVVVDEGSVVVVADGLVVVVVVVDGGFGLVVVVVGGHKGTITVAGLRARAQGWLEDDSRSPRSRRTKPTTVSPRPIRTIPLRSCRILDRVRMTTLPLSFFLNLDLPSERRQSRRSQRHAPCFLVGRLLFHTPNVPLPDHQREMTGPSDGQEGRACFSRHGKRSRRREPEEPGGLLGVAGGPSE